MNTIRTLLFLLFATLMGLTMESCKGTKNNSNATQMKYIYVDGNNNTYTLTTDRLIYEPISKLNSSSGNYDGGDPADVAIDEATVQGIKKNFLMVILDADNHVETRTKGTGLVMVKKPGSTQKYIISSGAGTRFSLERALQTAKRP